MLQTFDVHGFKFGVDACDWDGNDDDAETAAYNLIGRLEKKSKMKVAAIWGALKNEDFKYAGEDLGVYKMQAAATRAGMKGWKSIPDSGHNCELYAV